MKRLYDPTIPELMDRAQPVSAELKTDLHNLRKLNRYFGSYRLVRHFLRRWVKTGDRVRMIDLATGSGDIPRLMVDYARKVDANLQVDAVDFQLSTLEVARELSRDYSEVSFHCADVLTFGEPRTYDIVCCSLALHHFSEEDAVRLLRHCRGLSRRYVLVSDLRRGLLATIGVYLLTALIFREEMTRIDARLSAARAFSVREMHELARRAGWQTFQHRRFRFARQAIWMEAP
jgi:SAM-dependent methyltransferase